MSTEQYQSIVEELPLLSSPPSEMIEALSSDETDVLERFILRDPSLLKKVLSSANTAMVRRYGPEVYSVHDAIVRLGMLRAKSLILSYSCSVPVSNRLCPAFDTELYWYESLLLGLTSAMVADLTGYSNREMVAACLVGGILSHIGIPLLAHHLPEETNRSLIKHSNSDLTLYDEILINQGIDYFELGTRVLRHWGLPERLAVIPRNLHSIEPRVDDGMSAIIASVSRWAWDDYSADSKHLNVYQDSVRQGAIRNIEQCIRAADSIAGLIS